MSSPSDAIASHIPGAYPDDRDVSLQTRLPHTPSAAESAAAALRTFARGRSPASKRSSATSSNSKESSKSGRSRLGAVGPTRNKPSIPSPHSSTPSSPVSPPTSESLESPSNTISSGSEDRGRTVNIVDASQDEITRANRNSRGGPTLPPPRRSRARRSARAKTQQRNSNPVSRSQTPMAYSDLGKDYSRYPFSSKQSFFSTPPTLAARDDQAGRGPSVGTSPITPSVNDKPIQDVTQIGYIVDPEKHDSWLLDDRIGAPSTANAGYKFPLYMDEKEIDDDMHMPQPDDDARFKPTARQLFARDRLWSLFGMLLMFVGLLCIFILLPVLSYTGAYDYSYPYHSGKPDNAFEHVQPWAEVNKLKYQLLKNIRTGLIDPETPKSAMTRKSFLGEDLVLVFSDEFTKPNRTFYEGDDPFWTAPDFWYGATQDLEWYDPDAVTTADGTLTLRMDAFINHGLNYRSGMLNSWNQACFKGGALEISASLPGPGGASGLWPGAWTMGNLGRPGYKASTDGIWPYTYNSCDTGITPNQSMTDGTSYLLGQKLPSCTCPGEDHPTPGRGRGASEIDVFEASADPILKLGLITQSYQVAPYDIWYHPNYEFLAVPNYNVTQLNEYCGGPYQQAISGQTELNNKWYNGELYQKYGFEYTPGTGEDGQIAWFVGDDVSYMINGHAIGPNGNVDSRPVSEEPMTVVLNLGISPAWTGINFAELVFPTTMYVDYVRWYQPAGKSSVTCDPPGYETTEYIKNHPKAYRNINLTNWDDTSYGWPKHKLNTEC